MYRSGAQDQVISWTKLIGFAKQLLEAGDALFSEFLSMFDGFSLGDFQISSALFQMMEQWFG